jgi:hypothetical protein
MTSTSHEGAPEIDFEAIHSQVDIKLEEVFASKESFEEYFYATEDKTREDLLVRMGVVLKKIESDPTERFGFMREVFGNTSMPHSETSLYPIYKYYKYIPINILHDETIDHYDDAGRPENLNEFKLNFLKTISNRYSSVKKLANLQANELEAQSDYQYPKVNLEVETVREFLRSFNWESREYSKGNLDVFEIETPKGIYQMFLSRNQVFGDNITIEIEDENITITDDLREQFERYFEQEVIPCQLMNSIHSLQPRIVLNALNKTWSEYPEIIENVILKANHYPVNRNNDVINGILNIQVHPTDLHTEAANRFGLPASTFKTSDKYSNVGGWFRSTKELWEALFNLEFDGEIKIEPAEVLEQNYEKAGYRKNASTTYNRVVESIPSGSYLDSFLATAGEMRESYRFFAQEDFEKFTLPEGYSPIAVVKSGEYVVGYKEVEDGVDVCFQLSNDRIIKRNGPYLLDLVRKYDETGREIKAMEAKLSKYAKKKEL